jgi:MoaA/NifB/PqqE/SkfB family radical SAM enzyme
MCNIWSIKNSDNELTTSEYKKIFIKSKISPYFITITGGEPFLRNDISKILFLILKYLKPKYLTIATNGTCQEEILKGMDVIKNFPKTNVYLNISLDGIGNDYFKIRGIKNGDKIAIKTYNLLKEKKIRNLKTGFGVVLSSLNYSSIPLLLTFFKKNKVKSLSFELAQIRKELDNESLKEFINLNHYKEILPLLLNNNRSNNTNFLKRNLRLFYYIFLHLYLEGGIKYCCQSARNYFYINFDGEVWDCPVKGEKIGNVRECFNFMEIFKSKNAERVYKKNKVKRCICSLSNVFFINLLFNPYFFLKILKKYYEITHF